MSRFERYLVRSTFPKAFNMSLRVEIGNVVELVSLWLSLNRYLL